MNFSEADTRAKLIDPAIHKRGWTEDHIRREETAGAVEPVSGRRKRGQIELRTRYEQGIGFALESPAARPLLQPYSGGEGTRRYYQDAAIRAVMERSRH